MKGYFRKTMEYAAGSFFRNLMLFLLLPLFTRQMVPQEYALYANLLIFTSFASLVYLLGIQQAMLSYYNYRKTPEYRYSLISSSFLLLSFTGLLFSMLIIYSRNQLAHLILKNSSYGYLFYYLAAILYLDSFFGIFSSILNNMEKSGAYIILGTIKNLSFVLFILAGTLWRGLSLNLIFQVMLFSSLVTSGAVLFWLRKLLHSFTVKADQRKLFSSDLMAKVLGFGLIMIPGTLAMMVLRISDRYMLTWLSPRGLYDVGIYAIGYRIGMILSFLTSLFSMVYFPYAMKIASNDNPEITYRRFFKLYSLTGGILGFAIILLAAEIFSIFIDRSYHEGIRIVFAGVVSCYLTGIFNMINISFYIRQKARHIALTVGAGAILNIVLNYFAIPRYGFYGAGIASIIAYLTIVIVNYIISEKMYRIGYQVSGMVISLAAMLIISLLNFITLNTGYISLIKLGILAFIVLIFGRYLLFTGRELALLKRYLQGNRNVPE